MRRYLLLFIIVALSLPVSAQLHLLTGKVTGRDNKPAAFTSIYIRNSTYGTSANEDGMYQFKLGAGNYEVVYRLPGYKEVAEKITIADNDIQHNVQLLDETYALKQVSKDSAVE